MAIRKKKLSPIGRVIKKGLIDKDMSKKTFATLIGANYTYVTHIMYGERSGAKYLDKIAQVLSLKPEDLKNCA